VSARNRKKKKKKEKAKGSGSYDPDTQKERRDISALGKNKISEGCHYKDRGQKGWPPVKKKPVLKMEPALLPEIAGKKRGNAR